MGTGNKLNLRLFAEGIELPVVAATVTCGINTASTATIQIVPIDQAFEFLPRTLIHLFFFDQTSGKYKLLFTGELLAWQYSKSGNNRALILSCADFTSYWDLAKKYYQEDWALFPSEKSKVAAYSGATTEYYDPYFSSPGQAIINILKTKPVSQPKLKGLLGGIVHLLESIGGIYEGSKKFRGLNNFFAMAEIRLHLSRMLAAAEDDTTSLWLLNDREFRQWIKQMVSQHENTASFRDIVGVLLHRVFHSFVSLPTAPYIPQKIVMEKVTLGPKKAEQERVNGNKTILTDLIKNWDHMSTEEIATGMTGMDITGDTPGDYASDSAMGFLDATEKSGRGFHTTRLKEKKAKFEKTETKMVPVWGQKITGGPWIYTVEDEILGWQSEIIKKDNPFVSPELPPAQIGYHYVTADQENEMRQAAFTGSTQALMAYQNLRGKTVLRPVTKLPRLNLTIFRPDIFFCPPPRSNVIFPDQVLQIQYERNFQTEITRMMVTTQGEFAGLVDLSSLGYSNIAYYFAPTIKDIHGKRIAPQAIRSVRFLLPHEIYSGITAGIDYVPDIREFDPILGMEMESILKRIYAEGRKQEDKIPFIQKATNFVYFKKRLESRVISATLKFSKYLVPGMPAIILDRYTTDTRTTQPHQFIGMIENMTHVISQNEATTHITMSHCRLHREILPEMLQYTLQKKGVKQKESIVCADLHDTADGLRYVTQDEIKLGKKGKKGVVKSIHADKSGEVLTETTDAIKAYLLGTPPIFEPSESIPKQLESISGQSESISEQLKSTYKKTVPLRVLEEYPIYVPVNIQLPFEYLIRPPWFSPIYQNLAIGTFFYKPLLGVGSIVDVTGVGELDPDKYADARKLFVNEDIKNIEQAANLIARNETAIIKEIEKQKEKFGRETVTELGIENYQSQDPGISIEKAVDFIIDLYAKLKKGNYDIHKFIETYTFRPIAELEEVLGSADLTFDAKGNVLTGTEGFHSKAFNEAVEIPPSDPLPGPDGQGPYLPIDPSADPRPARRKIVFDYVEILKKNIGLMG